MRIHYPSLKILRRSIYNTSDYKGAFNIQIMYLYNSCHFFKEYKSREAFGRIPSDKIINVTVVAHTEMIHMPENNQKR